MGQRTRERAARLLVASLLESDLSERELRQVADALEHDRDYVATLGRICRQIARQLSKEESRSKGPDAAADDWHARAMEIAKRKRKPKREIVAAIHALIPSLRRDEVNEEQALSETLRVVERKGAPSEKQALFSWLQSGSEFDDEYLKGIMRHR